jgi:hypothetical protein
LWGRTQYVGIKVITAEDGVITWVWMAAGVLWFGVDAALRWSSKLSERTCGVADVRAPGTLVARG